MRTGRGRERTASRSPGISAKKAEGSPPQETISSSRARELPTEKSLHSSAESSGS